MASRGYESDSEESIPEIDIDFNIDIEPYQFEPRRSQLHTEETDDSSEESASDVEEESEDLPTDMNWCTCSNCALMPTSSECRCCTSFNLIDGRLEADQVNCITEHPGFEGNCLNRWVLEASYYEFLQDNGPLDDGQLVHELYRYLAYRRFARWIWRRLGRKNRKILPACVVNKIRSAFPSQEYCGFHYPS